MKILLTNDDGIKSEKLLFTKKILEQYGDVYLVAPSIQQSAKSMALTIGGTSYQKLDEKTYSVDGTPVDCVKFAIAVLGLQPDLIVSGTNDGYNIGIDTLYSGTVGAVKQAQYYGFKTIAFSADRRGNAMLEKELKKTLDYIFEKDLLSVEYTLNVNFPREKFIDSKGIRETFVHYQQFTYQPELLEDRYIPNRQYLFGQDLPKDSDANAYKEGFTSISKIKL